VLTKISAGEPHYVRMARRWEALVQDVNAASRARQEKKRNACREAWAKRLERQRIDAEEHHDRSELHREFSAWWRLILREFRRRQVLILDADAAGEVARLQEEKDLIDRQRVTSEAKATRDRHRLVREKAEAIVEATVAKLEKEEQKCRLRIAALEDEQRAKARRRDQSKGHGGATDYDTTSTKTMEDERQGHLEPNVENERSSTGKTDTTVPASTLPQNISGED
jgi:hypothetical protein